MEDLRQHMDHTDGLINRTARKVEQAYSAALGIIHIFQQLNLFARYKVYTCHQHTGSDIIHNVYNYNSNMILVDI